MKKIKDASEEEMISLFLQTEINSNRFNEKLKNIIKSLDISEKLISKPNLNSNEENNIRKNILAEYRGYSQNKKIFERFPDNIKWEWYLFNKEDLEKVKYINYDYWLELTNNTRLPVDAVKNINNGIEIYNVSNDQFITLAEKVNEGLELKPLIFVSSVEEKENLIVLEGHLRLTSYILSNKKLDKVKVMIGFAKIAELEKWDLY